MADREDEIMGPDSFGGEDYPTAPAASTLRASIDRGDDRPLEIHVEGDDHAQVSVDSTPDPRAGTAEPKEQNAQEGQAPQYVTQETFDRFAKAVTHGLLNLERSLYTHNLVSAIFEAAERGAAEDSGPDTEDAHVKDNPAAEGDTRRWWIVELLPPGTHEIVRHRVRGDRPVRAELMGPTVVIGEHFFDAGSVVSIQPQQDDVGTLGFVDAPPVMGMKVDQQPVNQVAEERPYNPLEYKLRHMQETTEAVGLFDAILSLAAITPEQRRRMQRIVARGVAPDEPGGF